MFDNTASFSKTQNVTGSTPGLECSYAGGCTYAIESEGLYATLLDSANSIQVCGSECVLREDLSTSAAAVCELPKLSTTYSSNAYKIRSSEILYGTVFPADTVLYDDDTINEYRSDERTDCTFGMYFKEGHVGVLDEAKIFIN